MEITQERSTRMYKNSIATMLTAIYNSFFLSEQLNLIELSMRFLTDFFPVILFFVAYKFYGIYIATGVAIASSIAQVAYGWLRKGHVEKMHLITLAILVVFSGLTILLQDRSFIMWKPSVINWLFAAAFLGSQFVGKKPLVQRMMESSIGVPNPI